MFLFGQSPYDQDMNEKLERITKIFALFLVIPWLTASQMAEAAYNDTKLLKNLKIYSEIDPLLSLPVINVLKRHAWYLGEELCVFGFFSNKYSTQEKTDAIETLKMLPKLSKTGKPELPNAELLSRDFHLSDLITSASWSFFTILKERCGFTFEWLEKSGDARMEDTEFMAINNIVHCLSSTNDSAEEL